VNMTSSSRHLALSALAAAVLLPGTCGTTFIHGWLQFCT